MLPLSWESIWGGACKKIKYERSRENEDKVVEGG